MKSQNKKIKSEGVSSFLGLTSILDFIDEDGKVNDRKGLMNFIDNEHWEDYEMIELVSKSQEARKIVRDVMEKKFRNQLKNKPDAWFTRINKKEVDRAKSKGEDPFDFWYNVATNKDNMLAKNNFLNGLLTLYRMFFGGY